jgi:hypothetical protein
MMRPYWVHCPGCGRRRANIMPSEDGPGILCIRCSVRLALDRLDGGQSARAELLVRAAHKHTSWEEFRTGRDSAAPLAAAIEDKAAELCPADRLELEWEWDDAADRPTGRGRVRLRPTSWPAGSTPASALGAALADDDR